MRVQQELRSVLEREEHPQELATVLKLFSVSTTTASESPWFVLQGREIIAAISVAVEEICKQQDRRRAAALRRNKRLLAAWPTWLVWTRPLWVLLGFAAPLSMVVEALDKHDVQYQIVAELWQILQGLPSASGDEAVAGVRNCMYSVLHGRLRENFTGNDSELSLS